MMKKNDTGRSYLFAGGCLLASLAVVLASHLYVTVINPPRFLPFDRSFDYMESAEEEIDKSFARIYLEDKEELLRGLRFRKIINGDPNSKEIALTFDDGPHPMYTKKLLEILRKENVKACFFIVGKKALRYPHLVRAIVASGHEIGNHTFNHVDLATITPPKVAVELKSCGKVLGAITGKNIHLFRPPGGNYNSDTMAIAESLGYTTVLWTANAGDAAKITKSDIRYRLFTRIGNGGIILMHSGIDKTIDLLPQAIDKLKEKGYKFVSVDELIAHRNAMPKKKETVFQKAYNSVLRKTGAASDEQ